MKNIVYVNNYSPKKIALYFSIQLLLILILFGGFIQLFYEANTKYTFIANKKTNLFIIEKQPLFSNPNSKIKQKTYPLNSIDYLKNSTKFSTYYPLGPAFYQINIFFKKQVYKTLDGINVSWTPTFPEQILEENQNQAYSEGIVKQLNSFINDTSKQSIQINPTKGLQWNIYMTTTLAFAIYFILHAFMHIYLSLQKSDSTISVDNESGELSAYINCKVTNKRYTELIKIADIKNIYLKSHFHSLFTSINIKTKDNKDLRISHIYSPFPKHLVTKINEIETVIL